MIRHKTILILAAIATVTVLSSVGFGRSVLPPGHFQSDLPTDLTRIWVGPEYWANPLQDWQLNDGCIECVQSGGDRNVYLLTRSISARDGYFNMSVTLGQLDPSAEALDDGFVGFKIGIQGQFDDYRDCAVRGAGFRAGLHTGGRLFIGKIDPSAPVIVPPYEDITLTLSAVLHGETYALTLAATDAAGQTLSQVSRMDIAADWLTGGVALVCSNGKVKDTPDQRPAIDDGNWGFRAGTQRGGNVNFWFKDWYVAGTKVDVHPERVFGPILFSQYTLSDGILKMTAQMPPIGEKDAQTVALEKKGWFGWKKIGTANIDSLACTATFTMDGWNSKKSTLYRLVYPLRQRDDSVKDFYFTGTIRKEPTKELVVAAFTGNNDFGFPNNDFVSKVTAHNPDMLFFSGDQIYEGVGGYGIQTKPIKMACTDYLRKWYLYGWAYRNLLRDRPAVALPDDHDVYHGNIWGEGGKATPKGLSGAKAQDAGGYKMPPAFVNAVQRTQTSHLPDAYDPTPVLQDIGVYYCNMNYAGVSFAILEDRKFKSAPKRLLPEGKITNGWPQNPDFDAKKDADVDGAVLLGDRQLRFLDDWASDWADGVWMKTVLSQTIFANIATLPAKEMSDAAVPRLRILKEGEYPPDDRPVSDFDSNGWPQTGRNKAVRLMRKAFAFHIAGDQHLGSVSQYGVDEFGDAGYAFCVPSISNIWPRRWYPQEPSPNPIAGQPRYTGDYEDGFGNKITVHAVSNPVFTGLKPARLYDRATGYGIIRFNKADRQITMECWPRVSASPSGNEQYAGWPITIDQEDNYSRKPYGYLPTVKTNIDNPIVQVIDESNGSVVYTIRIEGDTFAPMVFSGGVFTLKVGPSLQEMKILKALSPQKKKHGLAKFEF